MTFSTKVAILNTCIYPIKCIWCAGSMITVEADTQNQEERSSCWRSKESLYHRHDRHLWVQASAPAASEEGSSTTWAALRWGTSAAFIARRISKVHSRELQNRNAPAMRTLGAQLSCIYYALLILFQKNPNLLQRDIAFALVYWPPRQPSDPIQFSWFVEFSPFFAGSGNYGSPKKGEGLALFVIITFFLTLLQFSLRADSVRQLRKRRELQLLGPLFPPFLLFSVPLVPFET